MKILFSPSEAKSNFNNHIKLSSDSLIFSTLYKKRVSVLEKLISFLNNNNSLDLEKFFGIKDKKECERLVKTDIFEALTCRAIQRYTGVAYQYLDFETINNKQQQWIYENTIIFSNLFGPLLAGDTIPYYRFKQGSTIDGFKPELFYKENFTKEIDSYIGSDLVVDLRAGFYEKFYKLTCKHITCKFIKNGKVVSHWAKAYRGLVLRAMAKKNIQSVDEFMKMEIENLSVKEILQKGIHTEIIFDINL